MDGGSYVDPELRKLYRQTETAFADGIDEGIEDLFRRLPLDDVKAILDSDLLLLDEARVKSASFCRWNSPK